MLGNILLGSSQLGDTRLNVDVTEVGAEISGENSYNGLIFRAICTMSFLPAKARDPSLDIFLSLDTYNLNPRMGFGIQGQFDEFGTEALFRLGFNASARFVEGVKIIDGYTPWYFKVTNDFDLLFEDDNTVSWSDIGSINFNISQSNMAGKMPMEWGNYVFAIEKLDDKNVIVYGKNGITILNPSGVYFGQKKISNVGLKNKLSIVNTGNIHFYITRKGEMHSLSSSNKGIEYNLIGFEEFFSVMNDLVMVYDAKEELIYICDGTTGYVYSIRDNSLGKGEPNLTGIQYQETFQGDYYRVFTPDEQTSNLDNIALTTGIYDFGSRKQKTITNVNVGTACQKQLYIGVDYRSEYNASMISTPWIPLTLSGEGYINCYGVEFKFKIKSEKTTSENFKIDYFKVNGVMHNYHYLDTISFDQN